MTRDTRDPVLQALFVEAEQELAGEALTARVMAKTRVRRYRLLGTVAAGVLLTFTVVWLAFGMPLFEFALLLSTALTTPLLDLGEGWLALLLLPLNTMASVLLILLRGLRLAQRKIFSATPWS
jgi:hypothetical protein